MANRVDPNATFSNECPTCHQKFSVSVAELQANDFIPCPTCGTEYGTTAFGKSLESLDKAIAQFRRDLAKRR